MSVTNTAKTLFELRSKLSANGPQLQQVGRCIDLSLAALFPHFSSVAITTAEKLTDLITETQGAFEISCRSVIKDPKQLSSAVNAYVEMLPDMHNVLLQDAQAICAGDPAAKSLDEVLLCYPGLFAISVYRLAHQVLRLGVPLIPRIMTEIAHSRTGIEIHPGATIGKSFVIDHGTGVVIGETTEIRDNVKLYQGVTLGALSVHKDLQNTKRHPTIESDVVIYANATILGGATVVGAGSIIGGNVWLTESVPSGSRIYHQADFHSR